MINPKSEIVYLHKLEIGDLFSMRTITGDSDEFYMFLGRENCNCSIAEPELKYHEK